MSGRNPREALQRYVQPLQAALHCVTPARLQSTPSDLNVIELLKFPDSRGAELRRRDSINGERLDVVYLVIHQHFGIEVTAGVNQPRTYRVVTNGYEYMILNRQQREVLAFHWHPGQRSHEHDPHVHIGSAVVDSGSSDIGKTFSRFHIPTGHISIAQVVRLLLTDFGVVPNRQDWEVTLAGLLTSDT